MSDGYSSPVDMGLSAPSSPTKHSPKVTKFDRITIEEKTEDLYTDTFKKIEVDSLQLNEYSGIGDSSLDVSKEETAVAMVEKGRRIVGRKMTFDVVFNEKVKICKEQSFEISALKAQSNIKIELSNCWSELAKSTEKLEEIFYKNKIHKEEFYRDPTKVLSNNNLAIRYMDHVYPWKVIAPILVANSAYGEELPTDILNILTQQQHGFFIWKKINFDAFKIDIKKSINKLTDKRLSGGGIKSLELTRRQTIQYKKTYNLTTDQIKMLNLKYGQNEISFTVHSRYQGTHTITTDIYLWNYDDKIVISDLDGTITRSDVLGHIFPMFGKDWSHKGVVKLYNDIVKNGYKILYLTARAICQSDQTKSYLREKLIQSNHYFNLDNFKLPIGPILTSPDGLISSFKREVIDRTPQNFKIECLTQILNLFPPDMQPYYAGFGNRATDAVSYQAVGVNKSKIFIINEKGIITQTNRHYSTTYTQINELVEDMFPVIGGHNTYDGNLNYFKPIVKFDNIDDLFN
jgi:phosphatidate phosphatase LPIN